MSFFAEFSIGSRRQTCQGETWYFLMLLDFRNVRVKPAWYYHRLQGKLQDDFGNILKQAGKGECSVHNFCLVSG